MAARLPAEPSVVIEAQDGQSSVTIARRGPEQYAVSVRVRARDLSYGGEQENVFFSNQDLEAFVEALQGFERIRHGEARLGSATPGECVLHFGALDRLGHVAVSASLSRDTFVRDRADRQTLAVSFELDPTRLPEVLRGFRRLAAARGPLAFQLARIERLGTHKATAAGRNVRDELRVGDRLGVVYSEVPSDPDQPYECEWLRTDVRSVDLEVTSLWAYGRSLTAIGRGMTARVDVAGRGVEQLRDGDTLGSA